MATMGKAYDTPYRAKYRAKFRKNGLCIHCGAKPEPPSRRVCGFHAAYFREQERKRRKNRRMEAA